MPVVPTVTGRQVESRGVNAPAIASFNTPNIGDALADAGQKAVGVLADAKNRANVAMTQEASLKLDAISNDLMNNPETGFLTLQGKNVIGQAQKYSQQFDQQAEEIAAGLPDANARTAFLLSLIHI